jgi:hypothetical protein
MNIFFWIIYYIKCGINIILARICSYFKKIKKEESYANYDVKKLDDYLYLVKLEGSYYQMGKQYGLLMKKVLQNDVNGILNFIKDNERGILRKLNPIIKNKMKSDDIFEACYLMYLNTLDFIPQEIHDYYKGVAETSEIELKKIIISNFFFELTENHCIMYSNKTKEGLLSIRTLDLGCPLFSQSLIVFNPINKNKYLLLGHSFVLGGATMFSEKYLMLGESFYDYNLGKDSRKGIPFYLLFHKIMAEANNIEEAEKIMKNAKRIGNLEISVSDCRNSKAKIYKYSPDILDAHQEITNQKKAIYSVTPGEKARFEKYKNSFSNAEEAINNMLPMVKSGELHVMIYYQDSLFVSVTGEYLQSYNNDFIELSISDLFN